MANKRKSVNSRVDIHVDLLDIPGLDEKYQTHWKIRALEVNGRSKALSALEEWQKKHQIEWKKIRKVLQLHGGQKVIRDPKKVRKNSNPQYGEVFEMKADKGNARLMFFYDDDDESIIICTNSHWKGKGSQDTDFATCARLKELYFTHKENKT